MTNSKSEKGFNRERDFAAYVPIRSYAENYRLHCRLTSAFTMRYTKRLRPFSPASELVHAGMRDRTRLKSITQIVHRFCDFLKPLAASNELDCALGSV